MTHDECAETDVWPLPRYSGDSKVPATFHRSALPATHSPEQPVRALPDAQPAGEALVQQIAGALIAEGAGPGNSIHSWRCEYPDIYGPCDCVNETAQEVARAVLPLVEAQVAPLRARLDAVEALQWPHKADVFTDGTQWCDVEGEDWPCPTIRTLRGETQVDPHPDIVGALETRAAIRKDQS